MTEEMPRTMRAAAIQQFGGVEMLQVETVPAPQMGPGEVLIQLEVAGVGEWDPFEREGGYAEMQETEPTFPYILGSEGAGTVAAVGAEVNGLTEGDRVYATGFLNPKGGFYAEYVAVDSSLVSRIPDGMTTAQAGVMSGVAVTALRGLEDTLTLQAGESVMIFGASGGIGHLAVQMAKRMGARVLAVASGADGVALVEHLGADVVVDGRNGDAYAAARAFAANGLDAILLTAGGEEAEKALAALRDGGRVAYPTGVQPEPQERPGIELSNYNGEPDEEILGRLNAMLADEPFVVHVAQVFPMAEVQAAHRALDEHFLGKLALQIG